LICENVDAVFERFNDSVKNNEEGIIIKNLSSTYQPNVRALDWIKLKSEYMDSIGDTLDLVIIGGYFGEKKRAGQSAEDHWSDHISVFLMGVIKKVD
jgi:ATP-dependent DNA ligase